MEMTLFFFRSQADGRSSDKINSTPKPIQSCRPMMLDEFGESILRWSCCADGPCATAGQKTRAPCCGLKKNYVGQRHVRLYVLRSTNYTRKKVKSKHLVISYHPRSLPWIRKQKTQRSECGFSVVRHERTQPRGVSAAKMSAL